MRAPGPAALIPWAALLYACGGAASEETVGASSTTLDVSTEATVNEATGTDDEPTSTGGQIPGCDGLELEKSGVLDLDIPAVEYVVVSGSIRVNGNTLPDADGPRGAIVFETIPAVGPPGTFTHTFGDTGAENYSIVLPGGKAKIRYVPDAGLCAAAPEGPLPCNGGVLIAAVDIVGDGVLDLDIPSVAVSGKVTQNGAVMPDDAGDRGHIELTRAAGDIVSSASFGATGPAIYVIALFPDTYDLSFVGNPALCSEGAAKVACNRGEVQHGVKLAASGVLDLDVPKVDVTGMVTVNGAAVPDGGADRGAIRVRPTGVENGGELLGPSFGVTGPVDYALSVVAGTYDIELAANPAQCNGEPPVTPCVSGVVFPAIKLVASGVLDLDMPMIEVSGKVSLHGSALPDSTGDRGSLLFTAVAGESATVTLGATDPVDYVLGLIPGQYEIDYAANGAQCDGKTAPDMPCVGGPLQTIKLQASGVLDVDIPAVEVAGAIRLNGAALPSQLGSRGSLLFTHEAGASVGVPLGSDSAAVYALTALPGSYDVAYVAEEACQGAPDNLMPCGGGRLLAGVELTMAGVLDLDIPAIDIAGAVTYATAALPGLQATRGAIRWTRIDGGGDLAIDLGAKGSVQYDVLVMPGLWVIDHEANAELCADGVPNFPCSNQVLFGCSAP